MLMIQRSILYDFCLEWLRRGFLDSWLGWVQNGYAVGRKSKVKCQQIELILKDFLTFLRLAYKFVRISGKTVLQELIFYTSQDHWCGRQFEFTVDFKPLKNKMQQGGFCILELKNRYEGGRLSRAICWWLFCGGILVAGLLTHNELNFRSIQLLSNKFFSN